MNKPTDRPWAGPASQQVASRRDTAVLYTRTAAPNSDALAAQEVMCRTFAQDHGIAAAAVVAHTGDAETGFQALVDALSEHGSRVVVTTGADRLGRDAVAVRERLAMLALCGVRVATVSPHCLDVRSSLELLPAPVVDGGRCDLEIAGRRVVVEGSRDE